VVLVVLAGFGGILPVAALVVVLTRGATVVVLVVLAGFGGIVPVVALVVVLT
jgi:hypothetical protein